MIAVPLYKKWLSYLVPMTIAERKNKLHDTLRLRLFQGEWLLEGKDALYSQGASYKPFLLGFAEISSSLPRVKHFLLLGTGLGSALQILHAKYGIYPEAHLVDYDQDVLNFCRDVNNFESKNPIYYYHQSADVFLSRNKLEYDLIGVDLFHEMDLSNLLFSSVFWKDLSLAGNTKSYFIINTIFIEEKSKKAFENILLSYFNIVHTAIRTPNYIYIGKIKDD